MPKNFPDAKILLLAIFSRGAGPTDAYRAKVEEVSRIIARLNHGQRVFFMNINDKFLDPQGHLIGFRLGNDLHPVGQGLPYYSRPLPTRSKSGLSDHRSSRVERI